MYTQSGRSMVEMLGVLAIIGVLSVGAIAGYSKAMMKYKLNKHAEQMNTVISAIARNVHSFNNIKNESITGTSITPYFIKMGEIPTEMVKTNSNDYVYDVFGQEWQIRIYDTTIGLSSYREDGSSFLSLNSPERLAICQNILTIAKEYSDNIYMVSTQTASADYSEGQFYFIMGDKNCNELKNFRCLKDLTLNDIYTTCAEHAKGGIGQFYINWEC